MINKISELAKTNKKISDFHLRGGSDISYRVLGDIVIEPNSQISDKDLQELLKNNCSDSEIKKFDVKNELDTAVMLGELRFRANFYKTLNGLAAVLRRVETKIPLMDDLNLPQVLFSLLDAHKGLVLVTGPTGSGKSTTLAAIINQINESRPANIITIEDPVEFIHKDKKSIVSQREVGKQTESFSHALKAALREDPDVILVGELRFRANFYKTLNGLAAVLRRVETKIPLMEDLNLPQVLFSLLDAHKGLVLVTGPTGSGKSTTLAAIINQINESRPANIITIEDPVEFIHKDKKSIVSQREVGKQTESFSHAL